MNCVGGLTMPISASSFVKQFEQLQAKVDKQCRSPEPWVCPDAVTLAEQAGLQLDEWQRSACLDCIKDESKLQPPIRKIYRSKCHGCAYCTFRRGCLVPAD